MNSGSPLWEAMLAAALLELQVHRSYLHCSGTGLTQKAEVRLEILLPAVWTLRALRAARVWSSLSVGVFPPTCHPCGCVVPGCQLQGAPSALQPRPLSCRPPNLFCPRLAFKGRTQLRVGASPPGPCIAFCRTCSSRKGKYFIWCSRLRETILFIVKD